MTDYDINNPTGMKNAVEWTNDMLSRIKQGGCWFVPRCASSYTIDHANKTATRHGMMPDSAITRVLTECGWKVID